MNQKIHSFTYQKLFIITSDLKKTFMLKTKAVDNFVIMQFFNININITVELSAHLYITLCSKITAKINKYLI